MMDHPRSSSGNGNGNGNGEDNVGIPEDLRCKRSDGKQWRCSAMSMPDKTVCEKHYIQAKKRAANSAMRASLKKSRRRPSVDTTDIYFETKNDQVDDAPFLETKSGELSTSIFSNKYKDKFAKSHTRYSLQSAPVRNLSSCNSLKVNDDRLRELEEYDDNDKSLYKMPPSPTMDLSRNKSQSTFEANSLENSDGGSSESLDEDAGLTCHQCRRNDSGRVIWCLKCDRRGYCVSCISKWYPDVPFEELQRVCPACRGTCNCKVCLRGDNLVKLRLREIPIANKLQYLHSLLSSILPVVKQIHSDQCFELELDIRLHGIKPDIPRAKLHADEQMCCNFCRIPIVDYHRHCMNCLYDLCLTCCRDLRRAYLVGEKGESIKCQAAERSEGEVTVLKQPSSLRINLDCFNDWKAKADGSIPCAPKDSGGCGCSSLTLRRIFKMNWVAKLVKNVEEMVNGCKICNVISPQPHGSSNTKLCQFAKREDSNDNFLYYPTSQDIEIEGFHDFQKHWVRGEPVIVKHAYDCTSCSSWDPMVIWRGIRETTDEKMKGDSRTVKAIDCLDGSEVDVDLGQFIKGYTEGRIHENGWPEMLKLKDWPSPAASEEFLLYQIPEFISKLPLLEYVHSKWGILNVASKLPHYSLQNDVGPKILMSYGTYEELGGDASLINLHTSMRDMVYLLMHTCEVKMQGSKRTQIEKIQRTFDKDSAKESTEDASTEDADASSVGNVEALDIGPVEHSERNDCGSRLSTSEDDIAENQLSHRTEVPCGTERKEIDSGTLDRNDEDMADRTQGGALWDVFRRQDVQKLTEYLKIHQAEFTKTASHITDPARQPLFDKVFFLNQDHKQKLKEEFGIEPWTFEQCLGEAVFIPAGCPFQVRSLQSLVQLALDFLSPESLKESVQLAEEIRCLPNDHEAKTRMLEVGKMSLYAASSATKEVEKLALDPKLYSNQVYACSHEDLWNCIAIKCMHAVMGSKY